MILTLDFDFDLEEEALSLSLDLSRCLFERCELDSSLRACLWRFLPLLSPSLSVPSPFSFDLLSLERAFSLSDM